MARILLVEDEDDLRRVLRQMLGELGHFVVEARDGHEAMDQFKREPPDIVLCDLLMPEKEGLETIREMRHLRPETKIVAMSGGGRIHAKEALVMATYLGAQQVLPKPFTAESLAAAVKTALASN